ncbi:MAG: DMT family transporter [Burkholderiales bacterium]|nr:DMT family transporter [Anaerolineae bacterium]
MINYIGELAALGTALCFAVSSTVTTVAGRAFDANLINRIRIITALVLVALLHWLTVGGLIPNATPERWLYLGFSAIVGLVLGDTFLFYGFILIGARLSMLMMALAPAIAAVLAWIFLGESLTATELLYIALILAGIVLVVSERRSAQPKPEPDAQVGIGGGDEAAMIALTADNKKAAHDQRQYLIGLLFAFGGAAGQAGGVVLSKRGLSDDFPALSASVMRILVATIILWAITAFKRQIVPSLKTLRANPRPFWMLMIAVVMGPVLGVWLSLIAVQKTSVGVASTLMALTPIFLLPISRFIFKERITPRAFIGTVIAFIGTALLLS